VKKQFEKRKEETERPKLLLFYYKFIYIIATIFGLANRQAKSQVTNIKGSIR